MPEMRLSGKIVTGTAGSADKFSGGPKMQPIRRSKWRYRRGIGNDQIYGGSGDDDIRAGDGNGRIDAGDGQDYVSADAGDDTVYGQGGDDRIFGDTGDDTLIGGAGIDYLYGAEGNDTYAVDANDFSWNGVFLDEIVEGVDGGTDTIQSSVSTSLVAFEAIENLVLLTDGNLSRHIAVLEQAGLVEVEKGFEGKRPRTWVKSTRAGRAALSAELAALRELMERVGVRAAPWEDEP